MAHVSQLNELCQQLNIEHPCYFFSECETFECTVTQPKFGRAKGTGITKKIAKDQAAKTLLKTPDCVQGLKTVSIEYAWTDVSGCSDAVVEKLLKNRAEAVIPLLRAATGIEKSEIRIRIHKLTKQLGVLLQDFEHYTSD